MSCALTLASSLAGLQAARLWWRAARQPVPDRVPPWTPGNWTGDPEIAASTAALAELAESMRDSARLNAYAALWTGWSVVGLLAASALSWAAAWLGAA